MPYYTNAFTGELDLTVIPGDVLRKIETDSGDVIPVDNVIKLVGDSTQGTRVLGSGNTATITTYDASETQKGTIELATDAETTTGTDSTRAVVSTGLKAKLGIQTLRGIPYGNGTSSAIGWTSALTDGQFVLGVTGSDPVAATLTAGNNMAVTPGAGSLSVATVATPTFTSVTVANLPTSGSQLANKSYVDSIATGSDFKAVAQAASTAALTATYDNGTGGVGATLTNSGTLAALSVDDVSATVNMRILIKDQSTTYENGVYTVTTIGDASTAWVLTRAPDYDNASEIQEGCLIPVQQGTQNANTEWLQNTSVSAIGTDPITYQEFQSAPIVTTQHRILLGDQYNKISSLTAGTLGQLVQSAGPSADPIWTTATYPSTTAQGDLIFSSAANTLTTLAKDTNATRYLSNTGTNNNPAWGQIDLSNGVTGTLGVPNGGTGAPSMTNTNGVVYFDGTKLDTTTVGTTGQVFTSNGAGVAPTFQNSANIWKKLSTQTVSGAASIEFKSLISTDYSTYVVVLNHLTIDSGSDLNMSVSTDNGSTYSSTNYRSGNWYLTYSSTGIANLTSTSSFKLSSGLTTTVGASGTVWLYNFGVSGGHIAIQGVCLATKGIHHFFSGDNTTTGAYNAIKIYATGNITGTATLYGIVQ